MCLLPLTALADVSLGYGIAIQTPTDPVPDIDSGLELRATFGGEHADKWSVWLGAQPKRYTKDGVAFGFPVEEMPGYGYVAGLRRFNLRLDGPITLFAGTGLGYRDLTTCAVSGCFGGDAFVSSRWAFAQELGMRWRIVELSLGHFSTGGISVANKGVNFARFTLFGKVGKK
jgi:hypothetical protein